MHSIILITLLVTVASAAQSESNAPVQVPPQSVGPQGVDVVGVQPVVGDSHHHHSQVHGPSYYASSNMVVDQVNQVNQQVNKQVPMTMRSFEQPAQPESAPMPSSYKPFGSWGLYVGGNPADSYYNDYYKQLSSSVEKQQGAGVVSGGQSYVKPVGGQTASFSPVLKQTGSSYVANDYYPFAYSPAELNSVVHSQASPVHYAPSSFDSSDQYVGGVSSYATKKLGSAYSQKEVAPSKSYQSRVYAYPSVGYASPAQFAPVQQQQHQQLYAYSVPAGSQMMAPQPGVDVPYGSYGVQAYQYAVKPSMVSNAPVYTYSQQSVPSSVYKQQSGVAGVQPSSGSSSYYPLSFYGFPASSLTGSYQQGVVPQNEGVHGGPVVYQPVNVEAVPEKLEDKPVPQKKRA